MPKKVRIPIKINAPKIKRELASKKQLTPTEFQRIVSQSISK